MKYFIWITSLFLLSACFKGQSVDLIVHNAKIHTMEEGNKVFQAMAIRDGKIIEVGPDRQIQNKYSADEFIDAGGKDVYPGFTDSHGHLLGLAQQKLSANLVGVRSMEEMLVRLEKYASKTGKKFIVGRGWDQSLWAENELPNNQQLNAIFPTIPVALFRVDGHAVLVNDALLKQLKIDVSTKIDGGIIHLTDGKLTGLLVDNAMNPVYAALPTFPAKEMQQMLEEIQEELFQYGITGVHEAGINFDDIALFEKMIDAKKLKIDLYAMLYPSDQNIAFAEKNGIYKHKNLVIRSFKVIGDGALGSRGACLKHPYSDQPGHYGVLTTTFKRMEEIASISKKLGYQMNIHAIGDSTNSLVIDLMEKMYRVNPDHRWRIEHAQVLSPADILRLSEVGAFPSVQPTHAVSDQRWAEARLGKQRLKSTYAYQSILKQVGMIAIGTDFPVESINPFLSIHAAVQRQDGENHPSGGFEMQEAITLEDCLRGMTIWPAISTFQERRIGSLEKGKEATFVIFESPIKSGGNFQENYAYMTFIRGEKVFSGE